MEELETDYLVIGAGVIGLASAHRLLTSYPQCTLILVEAHPKFGQETSSRNSEVVHSGIYYPHNSRKTDWCIKGRELIYLFCEKYQVPIAKTGKYIVATLSDEMDYLERRALHCKELNVPFRFITSGEIHAKEPLIKAYAGLFFPESGIVDSHAFMAALENRVITLGGLLAYRHRVERCNQVQGRWVSLVRGPDGPIQINSQFVINAAGLAAAEISNKSLGLSKYEHRYCRGRYFNLSARYQNHFKSLIYPIPPKDGLGIHITLDLDRFARVGPDVEWKTGFTYNEIERLYDCDWDSLVIPFLESVNRYCPTVQKEDLSPGLIGIRAKLFVQGTAQPDFLVEKHNGFIHCLGIESPGLTASLAIAEEVGRLVRGES